MSAVEGETVDFFVVEYRDMLEENVQDYMDNFDNDTQIAGNKGSTQ